MRQRYNSRKKRNVIGSPPPVKGRRHETVQTERYLEELLTRPTEYNAECQTDLYLYQMSTPPYIPNKNGIDVATDIGDGDLFDFDTEVQPILDALIEMTVTQALEEVIQEEEIADLQKEKEKYLAKREAELAELRRLEAEEIRLTSEKERHIRLEHIANELDTELENKITAAKLLEGYVTNLLPELLTSINAEIDGKNLNELENKFNPWLAQEVANEVGQMIDSKEILEEIVKQIVHERADAYLTFRASESTRKMSAENILHTTDEITTEDSEMQEKNADDGEPL